MDKLLLGFFLLIFDIAGSVFWHIKTLEVNGYAPDVPFYQFKLGYIFGSIFLLIAIGLIIAGVRNIKQKNIQG